MRYWHDYSGTAAEQVRTFTSLLNGIPPGYAITHREFMLSKLHAYAAIGRVDQKHSEGLMSEKDLITREEKTVDPNLFDFTYFLHPNPVRPKYRVDSVLGLPQETLLPALMGGQ
ncbi:MAG: hypothetical protein ACOCXT_02945 [Candidatus Dojkabacteria bacterium]